MRYRVFLSYSHADARWARWLLRRLEGYRVPQRLVGTPGRDGPIPPRLGAVFCDRDELPSAGDLGSTIRDALAESAALVSICSPAAAKSRWVNAEIESFRALGRTDQIFAFVVAGDPTAAAPADACFPDALLAPDHPGAPNREPLAADARSAGDGRERAFLKLVAGLLGVGFDSLAQREAQQRQRRMALVTAASIFGMAVALALAATAIVARNDAQRRQTQAEDILGFMLGDLRAKLTTVGRLDLMTAVDDKATEYFATLDPRDLSDRALEAQARSLTGIGQVRLNEGKHDAAMAAFREAHARSTALYQRQPENGQRLFDLAQAEYWIGFVAWKQGRHDDAGIWLRKYRDSALKLAAMDRSNFDWQKEVAYSYHNLAVLDETLGNFAQAESAMLAQHELRRQWATARPTDLTLRAESAETVSWLGSFTLRQGRLREAQGYFVEQVEALRRNVDADPNNARWKVSWVNALLLLMDAQYQLGQVTASRTSLATATPLAAALAASDPDNNPWRVTLAKCHWWQAQLEAGSPADAERTAALAESEFATAHALEPRNEMVLIWLVKTYDLQARLQLAAGNIAAARTHLASALQLIEPAWLAKPSEALRLRLAKTRLLDGELAAYTGESTRAQQAWGAASTLLHDNGGAELPFTRLDPLVRVLLRLGKRDEAQPMLERLQDAGYVPIPAFDEVPAPTASAPRSPVGSPVSNSTPATGVPQ